MFFGVIQNGVLSWLRRQNYYEKIYAMITLTNINLRAKSLLCQFCYGAIA
jgi:hypothetical protein